MEGKQERVRTIGTVCIRGRWLPKRNGCNNNNNNNNNNNRVGNNCVRRQRQQKALLPSKLREAEAAR